MTLVAVKWSSLKSVSITCTKVRTRDRYLVHEPQHFFCYIVGGVYSPVIANMALDGLEKLLASHFPKRRKDSIHTKVNLVRYADDVRHVTQGEILLTEKGGSEED